MSGDLHLICMRFASGLLNVKMLSLAPQCQPPPTPSSSPKGTVASPKAEQQSGGIWKETGEAERDPNPQGLAQLCMSSNPNSKSHDSVLAALLCPLQPVQLLIKTLFPSELTV